MVSSLLATAIIPLVNHLQLNRFRLDTGERQKAKMIVFLFGRVEE